MQQYALSASAFLYHADCREALRLLPDNSIDSVVTDPPYEIGFMGKAWDNRGIANDPVLWAEVFRVLKPGGHVAAFGASRGYHRMACAIEDAGFEIRDSLMWVYGSGFPKSQNVSAFIDKMAGAERQVIGERYTTKRLQPGATVVANGEWGKQDVAYTAVDTAPVTPAAIEFDGFGTALKPAFEPIVLARKPLSEGTVAANVLRWRTGALNIDACRVGTEILPAQKAGQAKLGTFERSDMLTPEREGRWPANVCHDGSDEVIASFPQSNGQLADASTNPDRRKTQNVYGAMKAGNGRVGEASAEKRYTNQGSTNFAPLPGQRRGDSGSAARFFYSAKASKADRAGSKHPTVKPISLMEWLATLITPPGGTILDPFAGSGTTAIAAQNKGFNVVVCEREVEYVSDIRARFGVPRIASPSIVPALAPPPY